MKKVSVILPTFNDLEYLKLSLASIINQTYQNFEVVVVNDGSEDGTKEYLDLIDDNRFKIVHQENGGAFAAINRGIREAGGELVTWVSSDNLSTPYLLEALAVALEEHLEAKFSYGSYYNINAEGKVLSMNTGNYQLPHELITGCGRGNSAFMYYKICHDELGEYIDLPSTDTDFWAKLAARYKSVYVVEPLCFYRFHDNRTTSKLPPNYIQDAIGKIWKSFEETFGQGDVLHAIYDFVKSGGSIGSALCDVGARSASAGIYAQAMPLLLNSLKFSRKNELALVVENLASLSCVDQGIERVIKENFMTMLSVNHAINEEERNRLYQNYLFTLEMYTDFGRLGFRFPEGIGAYEFDKNAMIFSFTAWKNKVYNKPAKIMKFR